MIAVRKGRPGSNPNLHETKPAFLIGVERRAHQSRPVRGEPLPYRRSQQALGCLQSVYPDGSSDIARHGLAAVCTSAAICLTGPKATVERRSA